MWYGIRHPRTIYFLFENQNIEPSAVADISYSSGMQGRSQRRGRQAHRELVENGLAINACSIKTINLTTSSSASQKYWGETKDANMSKPSDSPRPYERSTMQNVPADQLQTTSIDNGRSQMQLIAKSEKRKRL